MDKNKYICQQIEKLCGYNKVIHYTLNHTTLYIFTLGIGRTEITYHLEYFHKYLEKELFIITLNKLKLQNLYLILIMVKLLNLLILNFGYNE